MPRSLILATAGATGLRVHSADDDDRHPASGVRHLPHDVKSFAVLQRQIERQARKLLGLELFDRLKTGFYRDRPIARLFGRAHDERSLDRIVFDDQKAGHFENAFRPRPVVAAHIKCRFVHHSPVVLEEGKAHRFQSNASDAISPGWLKRRWKPAGGAGIPSFHQACELPCSQRKSEQIALADIAPCAAQRCQRPRIIDSFRHQLHAEGFAPMRWRLARFSSCPGRCRSSRRTTGRSSIR